MTGTADQRGTMYEGTRYYRVAAAEGGGAGPDGGPRRFWAALGRLRKRLWGGLDWLFSSAVRWVFLTFMFVYLFAMAMVLFEADAFQSLVSRLAVTAADPRDQAGNARLRDILQATHDLDLRRQGREHALIRARFELQGLALEAERASAQAQRTAEELCRESPAAGAPAAGAPTAGAPAAGGTDPRCVQAQQLAAQAADRARAARAAAGLRADGAIPGPESADDAVLEVSIARQLDALNGAADALSSIGATAELQLKRREEDRQAQQARYRRLLAELGGVVAEIRASLVEHAQGDPECEPGGPAYRVLPARAPEPVPAALSAGVPAGVPGAAPPAAAPAAGSPAVAPPAGAPGGVCLSLKGLLALEDSVRQVSDYDLDLESVRMALPKIWAQLPKDSPEVALAHSLADMADALTKLAEPSAGADPGPGPSPPATARTGDTQPLATIAVPLTREGTLALRRAMIAFGYLDRARSPADPGALDPDLVQAIRAFQRASGLAVDGRPGGATLAAVNRRIASPAPATPGAVAAPAKAAAPAPGDAARQAFAAQEDRLKQAIAQIRLALRENNVDLDRVSALTAPVANLRAAVEALAGIEVAVARPPGGAGAADGMAEAAYTQSRQQARVQLDKASALLAQTYAALNASFKRAGEGGDAHSVHVIAESIGLDDPQAHAKAATIWREYQALQRFQPLLTPLDSLRPPGVTGADCPNLAGAWARLGCRAAGIGFRAKELAVLTRQNLDLMVVFVLGAIGSLVYITQYQLKQIMAGRGLDTGGATRYMSWYFFRPIFGIVIAFAIYLLYKTGQTALGAGSSSILSNEVNLPILALISLFAGLLSWQALDTIESRGGSWLRAQRRENLWATGLETALRHGGKTIAELAAQIGRSESQIERWIAGRDKVTPEMQDRIATWLERSLVELFNDTRPSEVEQGKMRWATGLAAAIDSADTAIDVPTLAALVGKDPEVVAAWRDLRLQVDEGSQLLLGEVLGRRPSELFSETRPDQGWWAVGLRAALEREASPVHGAADLAAAVGSSPETIRRLMELAAPVPKALQEAIARALGLPHSQIFATAPPPVSDFLWAARLRSAMARSAHKRAAQLAEAADAEVYRVRAWMEQEIGEGEQQPPYVGQVPPFTRKRIARVLGVAEEEIFRAERAPGDFKWVAMPTFQVVVANHGGPVEFAERIDADRARLQRWMDGVEPVAPETRIRIKQELGLPLDDETLFELRSIRDRQRLEGDWWATGLRAELARPGARATSLRQLAEALGMSPAELLGFADMAAPVPAHLREKIARALGVANDALFSNRAPAPSAFRWAPHLRARLASARQSAADLAEEIESDPVSVRNWMELDERELWRGSDGQVVRLGQVPPATQEHIAQALGLAPGDLFDGVRPSGEYRWVVQPTFGIAVASFGGGRDGFAAEIDADPDRVERWLQWQEQVAPGTQRQINRTLSLPADDRRLFDTERRTEQAQG